MSLRKYTKADYRRVMELRNEGLSFRVIGEKIGCSWQIARWLTTREHRLPEKLPDHFKKPGSRTQKQAQRKVQKDLFVHDPYYIL